MRLFVTTLLMLFLISCDSSDSGTDNGGSGNDRNYKEDMRNFVIGISQKAKAVKPGFAVIPQNGIELVTIDGEPDSAAHTAYLDAIDGHGQEDFLYGYDNDDEATPASVTSYLKSFLNKSKLAGNSILVTDYCWSPSKVSDSYAANNAMGYVSYAAPERALTVIPSSEPYDANNTVVTSLAQAKNFIFFINPENFTTKADFINAVTATNYDAVIIDLFLNNEQFTAAEVSQMRNKANGGKRLVICYMSIGEAEDYRYYWQQLWNNSKPSWIAAENPDWPGNYKVQYWSDDWQGIIYKNSDSYLTKITSAEFDGVYLDIIDAFEYFEK